MLASFATCNCLNLAMSDPHTLHNEEEQSYYVTPSIEGGMVLVGYLVKVTEMNRHVVDDCKYRVLQHLNLKLNGQRLDIET
eukprot:2212889-Amphidinium_carterae.1